MRVLITGGTGFVGSPLVNHLLDDGHQVMVLSRQPASTIRSKLSNRVQSVSSISAVNPSTYFDAVINLSGEGIMDKRWTPTRKKALEDSRIGLTTELVDLIERMENKPDCFISASAVGYYGVNISSEPLDESAGPGQDYAAKLCENWERAAKRVESFGVRTCIVRIGVVLHPDGGALKKMLPPFRLGLGGAIGDGKQVMPWIHRQDLADALLFLISEDSASGIFNGVAPEVLTNKQLTQALGKALRRPTFFTVPGCALKLALGEAAQLLTEGQAVQSKRLQEAGFTFSYLNITQALSSLV
ncbi:TIGR01777 family oxidoreductase [Endozoicomonas ascidiicola]|uniref:TIGR01777 family oxidoreductase n=1 Tax=Endozoicomonas ascidiicola TaxID=1698521 RepID=UPI0008337159|nr:TIGR01777 family oxidoreductase [Endozoicomonas ascidiicola]